MKRFLSLFFAFSLILSQLTTSFAEVSIDSKTVLPSDVSILSKQLNSTPIQLNDGSYFIPDNRLSTLSKLQKETNLARSNGLISPQSNGVVLYGYAVKTQPIYTPSGYTCTVQATAYVKVIYEYSVYRFLECQSVNWTASGTSAYTVNPSNGNYNISGDGRYLNVAGAFNLETSVSVSAGPSFNLAGWSLGASIGGNIIVRRFEYPTFQFDGNYSGAIIH